MTQQYKIGKWHKLGDVFQNQSDDDDFEEGCLMGYCCFCNYLLYEIDGYFDVHLADCDMKECECGIIVCCEDCGFELGRFNHEVTK